MAGKKLRPSFKIAGRRMARRRAPRAATAITTNRPPNPIVRATRSLIGLLPFGKDVIRPLADFVFRGFGLTNGINQKQAQLFMTGCVNLFFLTPASTLCTSDYCIRKESYDIPVGGQISTCVKSVKMKQLTINFRNETKRGNRQGRWAAAIIPFKTEKEQADLDHFKGVYFSFKDVCTLPFARFGPADSPITIGFRFKNPNEFCSREIGVDTAYCAVAVAFEDLARQNLSAITTDEFSASISVSTVFQIKSFTTNRSSENHGYDISSLFEGQKQVTVYQSDRRRSKYLEYTTHDNDPSNGYIKLDLVTQYGEEDPPETEFEMLTV